MRFNENYGTENEQLLQELNTMRRRMIKALTKLDDITESVEGYYDLDLDTKLSGYNNKASAIVSEVTMDCIGDIDALLDNLSKHIRHNGY